MTINAAKTIWNGLDWSYLTDILLRVLPALLCITLHELSHGYVAYRLGDDTAKQAGRLTLNPIRHLDPVGLLMMLVFRVIFVKPLIFGQHVSLKLRDDRIIVIGIVNIGCRSFE